MKTISGRELIKKLKKSGFKGPISDGRHQFMIKDKLKLRIPNLHGSGDIHYSLIKEILRQANISIQEWQSLA